MTKGKQSELQNTRLSSYQGDEIDLPDLPELFRALWQGKLTILLCTLFFAVFAVIYVLNAQQWWTAKALITLPKVADVVTFSQAVKRYQPAFDVYQTNEKSNALKGQMLSSGELDALIEQEAIFDRFVLAFNASDNKRSFLKQAPAYKEVLEQLGVDVNDSHAYRVAINGWLRKLRAVVDNKKRPELITLSAQSITDSSSLELLNDYTSFINKKVTEGLMEDLRSTLRIKNNELSQQLESLNELAAQQLELEIAKAEQALIIASAANIRKPVQNLNKEELFAIDLGADAISEKVNVLKSLEDLSILDPNISQISSKLTVLKREFPKIENISVFSYLESAELPLNRDVPKRTLIVVTGCLLGFILGVAVVLVRYVLNKDV